MGRLSRRAFLAGSAAVGLSGAIRRGKGARTPADQIEFDDPLTERTMFRLTDPAVLHHLPHYHHRCLSRKNDFALIAGEQTGERQIYRYEFSRSRMIQLTDGPGVYPYSPTLGPRENSFFVLQAGRLLEVSAKSGRSKKLYERPPGWRFTGHLSVTRDARYAALIEMREGDQADGIEEQFNRRPRCRLRAVPLKNRGEARTLVEEDHWLAHPQFRPGRTDIVYAREGPWHKVDGRIRLVSLDGARKKVLTPRRAEEGCGHEFWTADGSRLTYIHYPDESGSGAKVRSIDPDTGEDADLAPCSGYGWLQGNMDSTVLVGASRRLSGPNVYILFTRLQREFTLCEHSSSRKPYPLAGTNRSDPYAAMPEAIFSEDSRWVYFTSDREGKPAIYRTKIDDIVAQT